MNSAIALLTCLLVFYAQGQPSNRSSKCKCSNGYIGRVSQHFIKGEPVIHLPSIFCPHTEIIITTTANKEKCVNPQSPLGKLILKNKEKYEKDRAVKPTTTARSTRLHTTPRLQDSTMREEDRTQTLLL